MISSMIKPKSVVFYLIAFYLICSLTAYAGSEALEKNPDYSHLITQLVMLVTTVVTGLFTYMTSKDRHRIELEKEKLKIERNEQRDDHPQQPRQDSKDRK